MALSLMGLWELRTPGFLGRGKAQELTEKEGVVGAFFKGIITTLLAIPCGAPLLSPALKWAQLQVTAGAPQNVYLVFGVIGLGMASPYLIIGANPELLRFLPKPGAWMETFKKAMGYCLLPAVVWILYFLPLEDVVATVALLFAVWAACWLVGRLPITEPTATKAWSWVVALLLVAGTYYVSFHLILRPAAEKQVAKAAAAQIADGQQDEGVFQRFVKLQGDGGAIQLPTGSDTAVVVDPSGGTGNDPAGESSEQVELPWEPFDRERFEQLVAANKTILVDFTADWCLTCKTLEALVLNTRQTRSAVDRNGVVTLMADWTRGDPEVTEMLEILGSRQVPVVAIFPAGNPNEPIVLRGGYKQSTLLEAIKKAGPSAGVSPNGRTAMRVE
jgi:thiol:disulfide interchange protein DsbD